MAPPPLALLLASLSLPAGLAAGTGKKKAPTLGPGDGRKRDWAKIIGHIEVEWVTQDEGCERDGRDGDVVTFNHKGFVHELGKGKTQGTQFSNGQQFDANVDKDGTTKPLETMLGKGRIIVGMEAVLRTMCEGETVRATIPGPLAFDTRAGFLPYGTSVMYEMEVVSVKKGTGEVPIEPEGVKGQASIGSNSSSSTPIQTPSQMGWVLLLIFVMICGGASYLLSRSSSQGKTKKKSKDKKDAKKSK
mmetsp:Transcript_117070/g.331327  ORF Transcript_117070/g.331327 Transcript_117070/m.331327 type:complete len:246 (-) Transcript_117070:138-875(-)